MSLAIDLMNDYIDSYKSMYELAKAEKNQRLMDRFYSKIESISDLRMTYQLKKRWILTNEDK